MYLVSPINKQYLLLIYSCYRHSFSLNLSTFFLLLTTACKAKENSFALVNILRLYDRTVTQPLWVFGHLKVMLAVNEYWFLSYEGYL
jgi:hypothetical protein